MLDKPPHNEHALELALVRRAGNDNKRANDDRTTMANAINVMPLDHQIAQKLRAVSGFNSHRAHDLIDLQLILRYDETKVDFTAVKRICERIFRHSNTPPWPTPISKGESWDSLYTAQIADLPVLQTVDEAVEWTNKLIRRITES